MSIDRNIIDRIENETDIVALASEFVELQRVGKNYMGLCPFHEEKTPSFSVSPEKNIAMCMGCGQGGRPIKFYQQIKNIPFAEAVKELAAKLGIELQVGNIKDNKNEKYFNILKDAVSFYKINLTNSTSGLKVIEYLNKRKINNESIDYFNLGYSPDYKDLLYQALRAKNHDTTDIIDVGLVKRDSDGSYYDFFRNRLMFPITNEFGKFVGFSARTLNSKDKNKYINSPDTVIFKKSNILYNINEASLDIRKQDQIILFEGFFDVISAHQNDVKNGIATMGTSLSNEQVKLIKNQTNNVLISFDGDNAGINATLKILPNLLRNRLFVNVLRLPTKTDPDDFIRTNGKDAFLKQIKNESIDAYEFEYSQLLKNTNIKNTNEVQMFLQELNNMLKYSPPAVIDMYKKRAAKDLNIDEQTIKVDKVKQFQPEYIPERKPIIKLSNKYEQAEKRLIILMIRSKEWYERVQSRLTINDYSTLELSNIRTILGVYYSDNDDFDLTTFKTYLKDEELNCFENKIQKHEHWVEQKYLEEKEIEEYISLLKETKDLRRLLYLKNNISEKSNNGLIPEKELAEFMELQAKLKNIKESWYDGY